LENPLKPLLLISVVLLAAGVGLLFAYCHGTTGATYGDSLSSASIHIDMTTTGWPVLVGLPLTLLGALLLVLAWIAALFTRSSPKASDDDPPLRRREEPFQE
jgi:hypothetical protein